MSHYHEHAIAILTKEAVELEVQCADIRANIPTWDDEELLGKWLQEADWKVFDLKRSISTLQKEAGQ